MLATKKPQGKHGYLGMLPIAELFSQAHTSHVIILSQLISAGIVLHNISC